MDEEVVLSKKTLKAISSETRSRILKALKERQKTQTELAKELGIAASTTLEHIGKLEAAGLIEVVPEYAEKKWKYYRLTKTGRKFVEGRRVSIVMLLSYVSAAVTAGLLIFYLSVPWIVSSLTGTPAPTTPPNTTGGSKQIMYAMSDLQTSAGSFLLILVLLFLLLTVALYAIAHFLRSRK